RENAHHARPFPASKATRGARDRAFGRSSFFVCWCDGLRRRWRGLREARTTASHVDTERIRSRNPAPALRVFLLAFLRLLKSRHFLSECSAGEQNEINPLPIRHRLGMKLGL